MHVSKIARIYFSVIIGVIAVLFITGWTFNNNSSDKKTAGPGDEKTTDEVFKNIKAMNGQPASQLHPAMDFFEAALGFNCGNCHVRDNSNKWEFEKDDKPEKRKTRDMIKMMDAINKENFKGEQLVTCFTCHRGSPDPTSSPVVMVASALHSEKSRENEDEVIKVPNRLGSAEEIISKYQQAIGGKEAFDKITSLKFEGKVEGGMGRESAVTVYQKAPGFYLSETTSQMGTMQRIYNGSEGWFKNRQFQRRLDGDDLNDLKLSADFYAPMNFLKNYSNLKLDNVQVVDNDTVYAVNGDYSKYRRFVFYFDTKTGLLIRQVQYNKTLYGELQIQTDYKDYRDVSGVKFPYEVKIADYEQIQNLKFNTVTANVPVDNKMFDPAAKQ